MNNYDPARDVSPAFVDRVAEWIDAARDFVVLRYPRAGGNKDGWV